MDEVIAEFLLESHENLDQLDRDLVTLEEHPDAPEVLARVFRTVHTIKGTCGFLGFDHLETVSHVGESLLSRLRDGELAVTPPITSALLHLVDAVREILAAVEATGGEGERDDAELVATLAALAEGAEVPPPPDPEPVAVALAPEPVVEARPPAETSVRVDVALLDDLVNLVGELVLARNVVSGLASGAGDPALAAAAQRLHAVTGELQARALRTRMQPVGQVWSKFPRVARDLAIACGKSVHLSMEGESTELDKTLVEWIKDPLTHLLRNAVDHGIEPPEVRVAAGKPAEGRLSLRAFHADGQVHVEMADDGAGIDPARVRAKAVERGLLTADEADRLDDEDVVDLIFAAGFSTAERVTNLSGRGVGMDVVRTNVERIGGRVEVASRPGVGTTFRVHIPLTLAIIPALSVTTGGERYAVPQAGVVEVLRLDRVEDVHGAPVCRRRGRLLPLVELREQLGLAPRDGEGASVVVLHAEGRELGLVVDAVGDVREIVVKPLGHLLEGLPVYAGATIEPDGRVGLVLDVAGLAARAGLVPAASGRVAPVLPRRAPAPPATTLLVFRTPDDGRMAVPLDGVDRLEELSRAAVELVGGRDVAPYRGGVLPLVHVSGNLTERRVLPRRDVAPWEGVEPTVQVLVHRVDGRLVGIVVDAVLDVVDWSGPLEPATRPGVLGTTVLGGRVTELLSVADVVAASIDAPVAEVRP